MKIKLYSYNEVDEYTKSLILNLQNQEWDNCNWGDTPFIQDCICCFEKEKLVSYLSIVKKTILHNGQEYLVAGLSEVVTDKDYRNKKLGENIIKVAYEHISKNYCDFSIFTCKRELSNFYVKGGWNKGDNLIVIGGDYNSKMNSKKMNLQVMIALFSEKAKQHLKDFEEGEIILELGENKMW